MGKRESFVLYEVLKTWGAHKGLRLWRQNTGKVRIDGRWVTFGVKGQADLTGLLANGRRVEIETKAENGKQSPEQIAFQAMVEVFGGLYILAHSVADVDRALADEGIIR